MGWFLLDFSFKGHYLGFTLGPYLWVAQHNHSHQDHIDVNTQWLIMVDFIHLQCTEDQEREPLQKHLQQGNKDS